MRKFLCLAVVAGFIFGAAAQQQLQVQTVPLDFRQKIAATANVNKADNLAWGVLTVQSEVFTVQNEVNTFRQQTDQKFGLVQQGSANHEQRLATIEKGIPTVVQHVQAIEQQNLSTQIATLQTQLSEFRIAACPALKSTKLKDAEKTNIDKICQSDSAPAK